MASRKNPRKNLWECSPKHIENLLSELRCNALALTDDGTDTQCRTLGRVLIYLGDRGLNTFEGTAAGYIRLANRVKDLVDDGWIIASLRENLIGPDGLFHSGMARYVFVASSSSSAPQMNLDLVTA